MAMLQATLALYRDAGRDTLKALPRSGVALLFLVLAGGAMIALGTALGGTNRGSGFLLGLVHSFLTGWYLALVHILIGHGRTLRLSDLREQMGQLFSECLTIGFALTIPRFVLELTAPALSAPWVLATTVLFNPAPEVVQHERGDAFGALGRSLTFMRENWPEWVAGHVLVFGALALGLQLVAQNSLALAAGIAGLYGPYMGFIGLGTLGYFIADLSPWGPVVAAVMMIAGHAVMLFRAALYKRLAKSSRRSRAWQAKIS